MHHLHFKYDYHAAILENQLRATPELMTGSTPNFNNRPGTSIYWGYFMVSSQEVSTIALAISLKSLASKLLESHDTSEMMFFLETTMHSYLILPLIYPLSIIFLGGYNF
jgi:hypothetical protein